MALAPRPEATDEDLTLGRTRWMPPAAGVLVSVSVVVALLDRQGELWLLGGLFGLAGVACSALVALALRARPTSGRQSAGALLVTAAGWFCAASMLAGHGQPLPLVVAGVFVAMLAIGLVLWGDMLRGRWPSFRPLVFPRLHGGPFVRVVRETLPTALTLTEASGRLSRALNDLSGETFLLQDLEVDEDGNRFVVRTAANRGYRAQLRLNGGSGGRTDLDVELGCTSLASGTLWFAILFLAIAQVAAIYGILFVPQPAVVAGPKLLVAAAPALMICLLALAHKAISRRFNRRVLNALEVLELSSGQA